MRVVPRASRTELAGAHDGALKIRVAAPPVDGAANAEIIKFLAKTLGVAKSSVEIAGGLTAKTKLIKVSDLSPDELAKSLG